MSKKNLCILYVLFILGAGFVAAIIYSLNRTSMHPAGEEMIASYVFLSETIIFGIVVLYYNRGIMRRDFLEKEQTFPTFLLKGTIFTVASIFLSELSGWLIKSFFPQAAWLNTRGLESVQAVAPFPVFFVATCVFSPITEEFIYRYALQTSIKKKPWNIVFIALLFGFLHTGFHIEILHYTVMGLCLGVAYEKTKDINIPIFMHIANNIIATIF